MDKMDIENMHPFCLPFSLCHDATSSSMTSDIVDNNSSLMHNTNDKEQQRNNRFKTLSPSDDLYTQSLLIDDSDIDHHHHHQVNSNGTPEFYSLHLDIDIGRTDITDRHTDLTDDFGFHEQDEGCVDEDSLDFYKNHDDWCLSHSFSLLSPNSHNIHHVTKRRKSTIRSAATATTSSSGHSASTNTNPTTTTTNNVHNNNHHHHHHNHLHHHHHQVFQHVVDPMDMIKSSPTLAQLNLNSNDDPSDNLWDTSIATSRPPRNNNNNNSTSILTSATSALSSASTSSASPLATTLSSSTDLSSTSLANCTTSIIGRTSSPSTCTHSNLSTTCNHFNHNPQNHQHNQVHSHQNLQHLNQLSAQISNQQQHKQLPASTSPFAVSLNNNSQIVPSCHHLHHHHHHLDHQNQHHSCSGVAPFGANNDINQNQHQNHNHHHQHSSCCQSQLTGSQIPLVTNRNQLMNGNNNDKSTLAQNQIICDQTAKQQNAYQNHQHHHQQASSLQQRGGSPALVTSSSSPLSSSTSSTMNTNPIESRQGVDNKLKENIDYLTSLLCNGNGKLEQSSMTNVHQSTISSTMVKSYATLAQSLSTEPKLLERQYTQPHPQSQQTHKQHQQMQLPVFNNDNNRQSEPIRRPGPENWFKPAIESSVSAADSTAESQVTINNNNNNSLCSQYPTNQPSMGPSVDGNQSNSKGSELRVLSSLLNSKCSGVGGATQPCPTWRPECNRQHEHHHHHLPLSNNIGHPPQQMLMNQYQPIPNQHQHLPQQQQLDSINIHDNSTASIPPNGRPITLTPLVANNGTIIQQKQQQQQQHQLQQSKPPLFAQPASPSASSTASSGGNNNSNSSSSLIKQTISERTGRPNSMSTDGSLSSHDDGFSSQIDNDDGGSTRADSDEDDDVDSDDESFYGDYTNNDLIGASISDNPECKWTLNMGRTRRNGQRRFFWQYNVQSKGPKGARICPADGSEDPFVLPEASDPVFSNDCHIEGVKHSGKARRGDGNDLTPNPRKLLMIGLELKKLGKIINDLVPVTDLPLNARNKTRKEKNKLASRACRLKKKAQHEANKIKLYGLQREHQQAVMAIYDTRKYLREKLLDHRGELIVSPPRQELTTLSSNVTTIAERCSIRVAGQTSDYVNSVLEQVVSGCIDGGLST